MPGRLLTWASIATGVILLTITPGCTASRERRRDPRHRHHPRRTAGKALGPHGHILLTKGLFQRLPVSRLYQPTPCTTRPTKWMDQHRQQLGHTYANGLGQHCR